MFDLERVLSEIMLRTLVFCLQKTEGLLKGLLLHSNHSVAITGANASLINHPISLPDPSARMLHLTVRQTLPIFHVFNYWPFHVPRHSIDSALYRIVRREIVLRCFATKSPNNTLCTYLSLEAKLTPWQIYKPFCPLQCVVHPVTGLRSVIIGSQLAQQNLCADHFLLFALFKDFCGLLLEMGSFILCIFMLLMLLF